MGEAGPRGQTGRTREPDRARRTVKPHRAKCTPQSEVIFRSGTANPGGLSLRDNVYNSHRKLSVDSIESASHRTTSFSGVPSDAFRSNPFKGGALSKGGEGKRKEKKKKRSGPPAASHTVWPCTTAGVHRDCAGVAQEATSANPREEKKTKEKEKKQKEEREKKEQEEEQDLWQLQHLLLHGLSCL